MTPLQQVWTLGNIAKEKRRFKDDELNKLRILCTASNPAIAKQMFMPEEVSFNTGFKAQLEEQLGRKISDEEFEDIDKENSEKFDIVTSAEDEES